LVDDDLQMFMDALEQFSDDENASFSSPTMPDAVTTTTTTGGGGVCFRDTVHELSASGEITHSPLKYAPSSSFLEEHHSRENALQTLLASLPTLESNQLQDSGSLQSLNLLEDGVDPLHSSSVANLIRDAIQQAWSEVEEEDDEDHSHRHHHPNNHSSLQHLEHGASQRHTATLLARAQNPNLTLQYVTQCCLVLC
jgi:hypothetical protein